MSFIYRRLIAVGDKLVPARMATAWNHPAGPKTIFFWAPTMKWALVIAGIGDIARPAEKLSLFQSSALAATGEVTVLLKEGIYLQENLPVDPSQKALGPQGLIWARYSLVIIPINYNLFFVNLFVGATGIYQLSRIYNYRRKHPDDDD